LKSAGNDQANLAGDNLQIKFGQQYILQRPSDSYGSGGTIQRIFDVDSSLNSDTNEGEDDHMHFARYLKERILTVDLWNGDSLMHFGTCKIPLSSLMRQGEPCKVVAQEYDISEPEFGAQVGGLQLLVTNDGRKLPAKDLSPEKAGLVGGQKHLKKVSSKPIDNLKTLIGGSG
jgi:hypothetical protein